MMAGAAMVLLCGSVRYGKRMMRRLDRAVDLALNQDFFIDEINSDC